MPRVIHDFECYTEPLSIAVNTWDAPNKRPVTLVASVLVSIRVMLIIVTIDLDKIEIEIENENDDHKQRKPHLIFNKCHDNIQLLYCLSCISCIKMPYSHIIKIEWMCVALNDLLHDTPFCMNPSCFINFVYQYYNRFLYLNRLWVNT